MAIDCPALPKNISADAPRLRWRDAASQCARWTRPLRLCLHLLRMWLGAILLGGRLSERWREPIVRQLSARLINILLEPERLAPPVARSQPVHPGRPAIAPSPLAWSLRRWQAVRNALRLGHAEGVSG